MELIVAVYDDWGIGKDGTQPVALSADRKFFRETTRGAMVIVGRKTLADFPGGKPLPNRENVVISRTMGEIEGCTVVHSLEEASALFPAEEEVFVIGGAQIYALALGVADRFYLTRVGHDYEGDTSFPAWDDSEWQLISREAYEQGEKYPHPFAFEIYDRIK